MNESKSWIILKNEEKLSKAKSVFDGSGIKFTTSGKRHLGAAIGSNDFRKEFATNLVDRWCSEVEKLSSFAITEPQAAFAAYTLGEMHRFKYFIRTIPGMEGFLQPLDDIINNKLLPAILGSTISAVDRKLFTLPIRDGGLGILALIEKASIDFESSKIVTAPLVAVMIAQGHDIPDQLQIKKVRSETTARLLQLNKSRKLNVIDSLDKGTKRATEQNSEKGASSWLSVLPLQEHGFTLNKAEFHDALALRYNRNISNLPSKCVCGELFDVNHAMNCKKGGFVSIRHDSIRDFEANLLNKVCNDVETEPKLQPVNNDEARLDIRARGFWRRGQSSFFDVRFTNTNAASQVNTPVEKIYLKHEKEKKKKYIDRVLNNEQGSFTPLVFSINGGMSPECILFHKQLADKIANKTDQKYHKVIAWIRCKLSFLIMRSALLCLRGSRTIKINSNSVEDFEIACDEAGLK